MEFADFDILRCDACFFHRGLRGVFRHLKAHEVDGALGEERWRVGGQTLARDEDGLFFQVGACVEEILGNEDRGCASV